MCNVLDPFYWAWLGMAKVPFSDETANLVLGSLKDAQFIQSLIDDLRVVFKVCVKWVWCETVLLDCLSLQRDKGYDRSTFDKQMAVMRGQVSSAYFPLQLSTVKLFLIKPLSYTDKIGGNTQISDLLAIYHIPICLLLDA